MEHFLASIMGLEDSKYQSYVDEADAKEQAVLAREKSAAMTEIDLESRRTPGDQENDE